MSGKSTLEWPMAQGKEKSFILLVLCSLLSWPIRVLAPLLCSKMLNAYAVNSSVYTDAFYKVLMLADCTR